MNKIGKFVLTATSLAPIFGAMAIHFVADRDYFNAGRYLVVGIGLFVLCCLLLSLCKKLPIEPFKTAKVKTSDKEVLAFLVVYLLPIFTKEIYYVGDWITPIYVVVIVGICVYNSNAFTFNPILSLLGFHFYEVEIESGMSYLLISRRVLRRNDNTLNVREISDYIYLQV